MGYWYLIHWLQIYTNGCKFVKNYKNKKHEKDCIISDRIFIYK
jgi:hypothetical protein